MAKVKISELPSLSPATLDTTYVVGISGSTTYKISINQLTSSLDTTFATDLVTAALSSSLDGKLSTSSYSNDSASFNSRIISGSAVAGTISGSSQISALGFVTGSYTTINSFNSLTQSFNSISQSFTTISGSVGGIDFNTLATTGSNTFIGNQTITGSVGIRANTGSWNFRTDGTLVLPNNTGIYGNGLLQIDTIGGFLLTSYTDQVGGGSQEWYFHSDGILNVPGNIEGADNLLTTSSFNTFTQSYYSASASFDSRVDSLENATSSYLTSLNGAISSSTQVLNGSGIFSSSAQLPTGLISSSTQLPSNLVSGSSQISTLGFITGSYISSSTYTTDSASFNSRIISGSAVAGTISGSAQITAFGFISSSQNVNTSSFATTGSNSFNGNQTITGSLIVSAVNVGTGSGLEGGEITMAYAQTTSLTGSAVVFDVYQDKLRIFEGAGTNRGAYLNVASQSTSVGSSIVTSPNLLTMQTITSASYAALTPVSGTLYIIIG